ncbi:MAG: hypothetical protein AAGA27_08205, partial [Pseudomonadota bacterium]
LIGTLTLFENKVKVPIKKIQIVKGRYYNDAHLFIVVNSSIPETINLPSDVFYYVAGKYFKEGFKDGKIIDPWMQFCGPAIVAQYKNKVHNLKLYEKVKIITIYGHNTSHLPFATQKFFKEFNFLENPKIFDSFRNYNSTYWKKYVMAPAKYFYSMFNNVFGEQKKEL